MQLNSILFYPNKNINNHVDYKSISILVTQKQRMTVKEGASFIPDIIILILYLNILVYKLKQPSNRLKALPHVIYK